MNRLFLALAAAVSLGTLVAPPVAAQSLNILLPTLTFPTDVVTPSTKGCAEQTAKPVCQIAG